MRTPFVYGRIVSGEDFTNRNEETHRLVNNFMSGINTVLISPRRWGKSSLVYHAAGISQKQNKDIRFVFLDLFNVRNEEQFYELLARQTLRAFATRTDDILDMARSLLGRFLPKVTFNPAPDLEFQLTMDWSEIKKQPHEILQLPETLAVKYKCRAVVCIDEFQNMAHFDDDHNFQKILRATWQLHNKTSYCLYGSKRNMMIHVFTSYSMPFYKFGDIIFLEKIDSAHWHSFISKTFSRTGKTIDDEALRKITTLTLNHPYYVQQLAQLAWLRTDKHCTLEVAEEAFNNLVMQLSMLFHSVTDSLSTTQINFLKAITDNVQQLSAKETLQVYRLGTSANIQRIKQALATREIIDITSSDIQLLDPVYGYWLSNHYFKNY
jgi:uncharacterized protein